MGRLSGVPSGKPVPFVELMFWTFGLQTPGGLGSDVGSVAVINRVSSRICPVASRLNRYFNTPHGTRQLGV